MTNTFDEYLEQFKEEKSKFYEPVKNIWSRIKDRVTEIKEPIAGQEHFDEHQEPNKYGSYFLLAWDYRLDGLYLDIQIFEDGSFQWFYMNYSEDDYFNSEDERLTELPEQLFELLQKHFTGD